MNRSLSILAVLAVLSSSAFAVGIGNDNPPSGGAGGNANQAQGQNQGQAQGQAQLQGQAQGQAQLTNVSNRISNSSRSNAAAFAAGNLTTTDVRTGGQTTNVTPGPVSLTVNEAAIPAVTLQEIRQNDYTIKNVPAFALGNVYPTSPCMGSSQVGGSGVGFSIGVGTSWTDDECGIRETSRSFNGLGLKDDALAILCTSKYAAAAPSCAKP